MNWTLWWILFLVVCFVGAVIGETICSVQDSLAVALLILGVYVVGAVAVLTWLIPS